MFAKLSTVKSDVSQKLKKTAMIKHFFTTLIFLFNFNIAIGQMNTEIKVPEFDDNSILLSIHHISLRAERAAASHRAQHGRFPRFPWAREA